MTRYRTAKEVADVVRRASQLSGAPDLLDVLDSWTTELIPVNAARPPELLSTYEVRLAHLEGGNGPRVSGLHAFVEVLRHVDTSVGLFSIQAPLAHYTGLLDQTGSNLLGLVKILPPDG